MNDERFYELTTKFLSNELTEKEKDDLTILLQIPSYKSEFERILKDWNNSHWDGERFDVDCGLIRLEEALRSNDSSFYWGKNIKRRKSFVFNPAYIKAAASVVLLLGLSAFILYISGVFNKPQKVLWTEKANKTGEKSQITLFDGTTIVLNAESRLKYPGQFSKEKREVYLDGEAYFQVAHDSSKPFIVHSADITTTVLGTRFNVSSFSGEGNITVALAEGKVKISGRDNNARLKPVILQPNEKMVFNKDKMTGTVKKCDIQQEIGWKDNILKFTNEPLANVIAKLERAYGIKFEFIDKSYYKQKITTNFQNATIWSISEVLKKLTGLKYKTVKENNEIKKVVFYKQKN